MKPQVCIVDDDLSFRQAAARLLRANGFDVETFASAAEFLTKLKPDASGCLVADLQMPGMSGLELQAALAAAHGAMPVVFLTGFGDIPSSVQAMRGGAEDFLEKRAPKEQLIAAVHRALAREASGRADRERARELRARFAKLSGREREVLTHVIRGALNKQIAAALGICERTVKLHRTGISAKLGVPSVAEWTRLAQEAGILEKAPPFPKGQ